MVVKTFFRKIEELRRILQSDLETLEENETDIILISERSLVRVDDAIRQIKSWLIEVVFDSVAEEVIFFKNHKPFFISQYIYYSKILDIETKKPSAGEKIIRKFYSNEFAKLKLITAEDQEFYRYYRIGATYLDHKYFTRGIFDLKMKLSSNFYNYDANFTTSHDHKIAVFLASERLEIYLSHRIKEASLISDKITSSSSLQWTSSKVSLVELAYALHLSKCFNGGNVDFSEIIRHIEKSLAVNLGNVYKTIAGIRDRKYNRNRFLYLLAENLEKKLNEDDHQL